MPRQPTTWLLVSGHRFLLRRLERALLTGDPRGAGGWSVPLALGCVLAAVVTAGCAVLALLRPHPPLDRVPIVVTRESGALYVRVGDIWHPALNLASARLVAATAAVPLLAGTIPGAHKRPHWQLSIPSPARQRCFGCWGLAEALDWSEQLHSWDTPESLL